MDLEKNRIVGNQLTLRRFSLACICKVNRIALLRNKESQIHASANKKENLDNPSRKTIQNYKRLKLRNLNSFVAKEKVS
jgi:hypothetical protein